MMIVSERGAIWLPFVPLTVKVRGFGVEAERLPTVKVLVWPGLMDVGLNVQVAPEVLAQASEILLVNEAGAEAATEKLVVAVPIVILLDAFVAESEKTATPVPVRVMVCGLPVALSVKLKLPVRLALPAPVGVKVMLNVQLAPGLRLVVVVGLAPQLLLWTAKSPVMANLVRLTVAVPLLVNVSGCAGLVVPTV